jgi:hypothetical protein
MILRLALGGLRDKPWRTLFLLLGFGLGVGVMIVLLAIGEAMVLQSKDEKLVGGGTVSVLPEGLSLEVMKTGGVGGMFVSIANARFVHRQVLASPRLADVVAAVAPQTDGQLLYLRAGGTEYPVRALGEIPSATRAVGAAPQLLAGTWDDDDHDRRFLAPRPDELRHEMDRFHHTPAAVPAAERETWGEWHYFNVLSADAQRWAFVTLAVGGDVPQGEHGAQVLITVHTQGKAERRFETLWPGSRVALDTTRADLRVGDSEVQLLPDGRYRLRATAREAATGALAQVDLEVTPEPAAYFPGANIGGESLVSGYAVPGLRALASGTLCLEGRCERFDGAQSYHDHNWGVWRDVTWEWGSARVGAYSVLYGRVLREGAALVDEPLFVYLVDSLGFAGIFRPTRIAYEDGRELTVGGRRIRAPRRGLLFDARGGDTLRLELEVEDAAATAMRGRREGEAAAAGAGRAFIQMKGRATLSGRLRGRPLQAQGIGFFETWR